MIGMLHDHDLPTPEALSEKMIDLGCRVRNGWCKTHNGSLLIHDGGRVACAVAWREVGDAQRAADSV